MPAKYQPVNDWTTKKVKLLKYWQEECRLYNWLYNQNVQYYQHVNRNLSIISILLSAVTGATLLNNSDPPNPGLILSFGIISIISSFIQGLRQFLDLDTKISANTFTSRQNSAIVIDIEEQLNLTREERINGLEFIKSIKTRKNEIIQSAPMISRSRWAQLKKKIKNGEGISFFNEAIFKNYLESTVAMGDLKLDTPEDDMDEQPSNSPEKTITPERLEAITIIPATTSHYEQNSFIPIPAQESPQLTSRCRAVITPTGTSPMLRCPSPLFTNLATVSSNNCAVDNTMAAQTISRYSTPQGNDNYESSPKQQNDLQLALTSSRQSIRRTIGQQDFASNRQLAIDLGNLQSEPVSEDELINELQGDNIGIHQLRQCLYTPPTTGGKKQKQSLLPKHKLEGVLQYQLGRL